MQAITENEYRLLIAALDLYAQNLRASVRTPIAELTEALVQIATLQKDLHDWRNDARVDEMEKETPSSYTNIFDDKVPF